MNRKKIEKEHAQLKERLQELTDFINSEEYYKLSDSEKQVISAQRSGMEIYINALSIRLWGNGNTNGSCSPFIGLLASMMLTPSFSSAPQMPKIEPENKDETEQVH